MKKVILCAILLAGYVTFANARTTNFETVSTVQVTNGDYKEVALTDLSEVVQEAVTNLAGDTYDIAKIEFDAAKEITKVTLSNKENGVTSVVYLNKEGKEVKESEAL